MRYQVARRNLLEMRISRCVRGVLPAIGSVIVSYAYVLQSGLQIWNRYPNWDHTWVDAMQVSKLEFVSNNVCKFSYPSIDLNSGFGWNYYGDTTVWQSPISPFTLLSCAGLGPESILNLRTVLYLSVLIFGTWKFLHDVTRNQMLACIAAIFIPTLPLFWGIGYGLPWFNAMCSIPLILWCVRTYSVKRSPKATLYIVLLFLLVGADSLSLLTLGLLVTAYVLMEAIRDRRNVKRDLVAVVRLQLLMLGVTSFYWIPLLHNVAVNRSLSQGYAVDEKAISLLEYLRFVIFNGGDSFLYPIEGSFLLLYSPYPFSILCLVAMATLDRNCPLRREVVTIAVTCVIMFASPVIFYGVPQIRDVMPSYFRQHLNVIPLLVVLAGTCAIAGMSRTVSGRRRLVAVLVGSSILQAVVFSAYFALQTARQGGWQSLRSTVLIPVLEGWGSRVWVVQVLFEFLIITGLILACTSLIGRPRYNLAILASVVVVCLLGVSASHELRRDLPWQFVVDSQHRKSSFDDRWRRWQPLLAANGSDYRILPVGQDVGFGTGRNAKLILESEMGSSAGRKVLFSYREVLHPVESVVYSAISGDPTTFATNHMPPIAGRIVDRLAMLRLIGVRYVVSADATLAGEGVTLIASQVVHGPPSSFPDDAGTVYLYGIADARPIATLLVGARHEPKDRIWRMMRESPLQLLDDGSLVTSSVVESSDRTPASNRWAPARIRELNTGEIKVEFEPTQNERWLSLSYVNRPFWKAKVNGHDRAISDAYGGFMAVRVLPGESSVVFSYKPWDAYLGLLLTLVTLICVLFSIVRTRSAECWRSFN